MKNKLLVNIFLAEILFLSPVGAINAAENNSVLLDTPTGSVYQSEWFKRFAPNTAADVVNAIPSFTLQSTEAERGIGQVAENILINGKKVSGKGASAMALLKQMPASAVVRVEVNDATHYGVTGLSGLVANIIVINKKFQGTWLWSPEIRRDIRGRLSHGAISINGHLDDLDYILSIKNESKRLGSQGKDYILDDQSMLIDIRDQHKNVTEEFPTITIDLLKNFSPTFDIGINSNVAWFTSDERYISDRQPLDDAATKVVDTVDIDALIADTTLRINKVTGLKTLSFIAFQSYEDYDDNNLSLTTDPETNSRLSTSAFNQNSVETESILRSAYKVGDSHRFWELSAELAYNALEVTSFFGESIEPNTFALNLATDASGEIDEHRAELIFSRRLTLGKWVLDGAIGAEYSKINVAELSGVRDQLSRDFVRPKGRISAATAINSTTHFRIGLDREVDQLDFFNFLGEANLRLNQSTGANVDLLPSQTWTLNTELEKRFGTDSKLTTRAAFIRHEDITGRRIIEGQDAVANVGDGNQWYIESDLTWRPNHQSLKQWQLNLNGGLEDSEQTDAVTGIKRPFSKGREYSYRAELSYQFKNKPLSVGIGEERTKYYPEYLSNEINSDNQEAFTFLYLKHSNFFGLNISATLFNFTNLEYTSDRTIYSDFRNNSTIERYQNAKRTFGPFLNIDIKGSF